MYLCIALAARCWHRHTGTGTSTGTHRYRTFHYRCVSGLAGECASVWVFALALLGSFVRYMNTQHARAEQMDGTGGGRGGGGGTDGDGGGGINGTARAQSQSIEHGRLVLVPWFGLTGLWFALGRLIRHILSAFWLNFGWFYH